MTIKYKEYIKKEVKGWKAILYIIAFIIAINTITQMLRQLSNQRLAGYISISILLAMIVLSFKIINRLIIEYEFILTHNSFKANKLIGKRAPKQVLDIKLKQIEYFVSEEKLKTDAKNLKKKVAKKQNLSLVGMNQDKVVGFYKEGDKLHSFIFQPREKMLEALRNELGEENIII